MKWLLVGLVTLAGCAGQVVPEPRTVRGAGGCPLPRAGSSGAELGDCGTAEGRQLADEGAGAARRVGAAEGLRGATARRLAGLPVSGSNEKPHWGRRGFKTADFASGVALARAR